MDARLRFVIGPADQPLSGAEAADDGIAGPGGRIAQHLGYLVPMTPPQLAGLQGARKAVLAKYRANLVQSLGPIAFTRLEQALITNYKVGPQATAPNPGKGH